MPQPPLDTEDQIQFFLDTLPSVEELEAKCYELGLTMRRPPSYHLTHPAVTLAPQTMSAAVLRQLHEERQPLWNEAVDRTARNFDFLASALAETAASDAEFTGKLVQMLKDVYMAPGAVFQPLMLGIFRTDYMRSVDGGASDEKETAQQWKNVEINTISCSFAGLSPLVAQFHAYVAQYRRALTTGGRSGGAAERLPVVSSSGADVPRALAVAAAAWAAAVPWKQFATTHHRRRRDDGTSSSSNSSSAAIPLQPVVLVVIQEGERNTGDQYKLLLELLSAHGVVSLRRTLAQLHDTMQLVHLDEADNGSGDGSAQAPFAVIDGLYVASVVYLRSCYVPGDFPTAAHWRAREDLERCNAIKCPSLPYHLLTFKKIQQLFCNVEGVLAPVAFGGDAAKARALAEHFMGQFSLNASEYAAHAPEGTAGAAAKEDPESIIADAIAHPDRYVLKPQLEGGGNLIAGEEMLTLLRDNQHRTAANAAVFDKIRKEYILMQKINFPVTTGVFFRGGELAVLRHDVCSELGIYGVILSDGSSGSGEAGLRAQLPQPEALAGSSGGLSDYLFNCPAGYVVRTKPAGVADGGVMAGVACLDTVVALHD